MGVIGVNLPCVGLKSICMTRSAFLELRSLMRDIIFAYEKSLYEDELYSFAVYFFSQMNNLVSSRKILVCETTGRGLIRK